MREVWLRGRHEQNRRRHWARSRQGRRQAGGLVGRDGFFLDPFFVVTDTAADFSVIPWWIVEELEPNQLGESEALGLGGHILTMPTFLVQIQLRGMPGQVVKVLASAEEPYVLLGRDVLNRFRVTLDGPKLVLEIE